MHCAFLISCSSIYHKHDGRVPEGYSDVKISDSEYQVIFEAYQRESWEELTKYATKRAAEIAQSKGYDMFIIRDATNSESVETQTSAAISGGLSKGGGANSPIFSGTVTPSYVYEFTIRKVVLNIELVEASGAQVLSVSSILNR